MTICSGKAVGLNLVDGKAHSLPNLAGSCRFLCLIWSTTQPSGGNWAAACSAAIWMGMQRQLG
jgi:hypothetical protein